MSAQGLQVRRHQLSINVKLSLNFKSLDEVLSQKLSTLLFKTRSLSYTRTAKM